MSILSIILVSNNFFRSSQTFFAIWLETKRKQTIIAIVHATAPKEDFTVGFVNVTAADVKVSQNSIMVYQL